MMMNMPPSMESGGEEDPVKYALKQLIKAMYGRMDFGEGDMPMSEGEMAEDMEEERVEDTYDPVKDGNAEPQELLGEEGMEDDLQDEIANFMNPKSPMEGKKAMTIVGVSSSPKKNANKSNKKKRRGRSLMNEGY